MKISFVIPTFNSQTWIAHAVGTCLSQTYKDIEVVVVDDGSTDKTQETLNNKWIDQQMQELKERFMTVITLPKNMGRSWARNEGNRAATGDIICVLDADDIATPNRAELTAKKFKSKQLDYVYGSATVIDVLGRPSHILQADVIPALDEEKNPSLQNRIVHSTVAYTRDFAERFKYRDGEIAKLGLDDWAQQTEAIAAGAKFDFIPKRLACYRQLDSQITKKRDEEAVMAAKRGFLSGLRVPA